MNTLDRIADAVTGKSQLRELPTPQELHMRIARDGTWFYRGTPINRMPLVKLFSTVLRRESDGDFWLITPVERGRIEVEDAPFTAVEVTIAGEGESQTLTFRTNLDQEVVAGPEHPIRVTIDPDTAEPRPYILVRDGLEALILRPAFYELAEISTEGSQDGVPMMGVWSQGHFFALSEMDEIC
jgi:hypothetical protein